MYTFPIEEIRALFLKHSISFFLPFLVIIYVLKWRNSTSNTLQNLPPSPPKLPIIGNLHQLGSIPQRSLKSLAQKYGSPMLLHLGRKPVLIISSPDAAEEVMKTHDLIFATRPKPVFAGRLLYNFKDITFSPYGEYWRQVRSICVLQLLSNKRVQSFRNIREEEMEIMLEKVRESCASSSVIRIDEILATLTNNIVSRVAIGKRYSGEESGSKFKEIFEDFTMLLGAFNVGDYIPWLAWINNVNGLEAKMKKVVNDFDEYLEKIVEEGMKRQEEKKSGSDGNDKKQQQNFVDVLLEIQKTSATGFAFGRDSLKAIILDMFVGGTDTTSALLQWAISELLRNTNAMHKLQKEVRQLPRCKSGITEDDLENLQYLKAVIKETLRLHPPVPLLAPRESRKASKIMGYDIAAGTQVIINAWAMGRDPKLWEDAESFWPERFLNSSVDIKGQHFQFIPFGAGRRSCPGAAFAMVTAELALANLVFSFDFELAGGARPEDLDMTEAPGIVTPRKIRLLLLASLPN
ncbi:tabersonine/lochnericine 19-hydroxylase-like [Coffea arabica]|uniref:Tabersonine/lochnericine 19-hydroxylase-like n=1 Tax=Coffea arabica TaxID=13443 RepID=A0A6P6WYY7_COFAR|nr:cytochrome P450 71A2-like [Coffea arabica]